MIPGFIKSVVRKDPSLTLHIGMPKTGSTVLQNFLAHNRERLQQQKILYPECGTPICQHTALVKSIGIPLFDWVRFNPHIAQFDPAAYLNDVVKQCRERRCNNVILSSEFFWAAPSMQAADAELHRPTDENFAYIKLFLTECSKLFIVFSITKIVVYLRRQDHWIDSFFNQQVKDGFGIPTQEDLLREAKNYLLFYRNIEILAEIFGRENLVLRNYDNLLNGDIITDFLELVRLKQHQLEQAPKTQNIVNSKLSRTSAGIMRKAVEMEFDAENLALFRAVLQGLSFRTRAEKRKKEYTLFDAQFYEKVLDLYREDNLKLAQEYIDLSKLDTEETQSPVQDNTAEHQFEEKCEELISLLLARLSDAK